MKINGGGPPPKLIGSPMAVPRVASGTVVSLMVWLSGRIGPALAEPWAPSSLLFGWWAWAMGGRQKVIRMLCRTTA